MGLPKALGLASALALAAACGGAHANDRDDHAPAATPIKHVVVIFQENVWFDHYFCTHPNALNLSGETKFMASPRTPKVNSLATPLDLNHHFTPIADSTTIPPIRLRPTIARSTARQLRIRSGCRPRNR